MTTWKTVPVEPTQEMLDAAWETSNKHLSPEWPGYSDSEDPRDYSDLSNRDYYQAMLAAAPEPTKEEWAELYRQAIRELNETKDSYLERPSPNPCSSPTPQEGYENPEDRWIRDQENACPHCGGSGHKDDVEAPEPPAMAVRVKPLEWNPYRAKTPFGYYHIDDQSDRSFVVVGGRPRFLLSGSRIDPSRHWTLADARAAAQADYDHRILSALEDAK